MMTKKTKFFRAMVTVTGLLVTLAGLLTSKAKNSKPTLPKTMTHVRESVY